MGEGVTDPAIITAELIPLTISARRIISGVELILWSDGKASRHWPGGDEWISVAEFRKGKIGQAVMFG